MVGLVELLLAAAALGATAIVLHRVVRRVAAYDRAAVAAARDAHTRTQRQLADAAESGANPDNPIEIRSPAAVEARAEARPCPQCAGPCHVTEHVVHQHRSGRLRLAHLQCGQCGTARSLYFRLATTPLLN